LIGATSSKGFSGFSLATGDCVCAQFGHWLYQHIATIAGDVPTTSRGWIWNLLVETVCHGANAAAVTAARGKKPISTIDSVTQLD